MEARLDTVDRRIRAIEDIFGFVPTVTPAPLLGSSISEGTPKAHPLVKEWLQLLFAAEDSRIKLTSLRRIYADTAPAVKAVATLDESLRTKSKALRMKVLHELQGRITQRKKLLAHKKPSHPAVQAFDEAVASILWLVAVTKHVMVDGRACLAIPRDMIGPKASEILIAVHMAGAKPANVQSLYRTLLTVEMPKYRLDECINVPVLAESVLDIVSREKDLLLQARLLQTRTIDNCATNAPIAAL